MNHYPHSQDRLAPTADQQHGLHGSHSSKSKLKTKKPIQNKFGNQNSDMSDPEVLNKLNHGNYKKQDDQYLSYSEVEVSDDNYDYIVYKVKKNKQQPQTARHRPAAHVPTKFDGPLGNISEKSNSDLEVSQLSPDNRFRQNKDVKVIKMQKQQFEQMKLGKKVTYNSEKRKQFTINGSEPPFNQSISSVERDQLNSSTGQDKNRNMPKVQVEIRKNKISPGRQRPSPRHGQAAEGVTDKVKANGVAKIFKFKQRKSQFDVTNQTNTALEKQNIVKNNSESAFGIQNAISANVEASNRAAAKLPTTGRGSSTENHSMSSLCQRTDGDRKIDGKIGRAGLHAHKANIYETTESSRTQSLCNNYISPLIHKENASIKVQVAPTKLFQKKETEPLKPNGGRNSVKGANSQSPNGGYMDESLPEERSPNVSPKRAYPSVDVQTRSKKKLFQICKDMKSKNQVGTYRAPHQKRTALGGNQMRPHSSNPPLGKSLYTTQVNQQSQQSIKPYKKVSQNRSQYQKQLTPKKASPRASPRKPASPRRPISPYLGNRNRPTKRPASPIHYTPTEAQTHTNSRPLNSYRPYSPHRRPNYIPLNPQYSPVGGGPKKMPRAEVAHAQPPNDIIKQKEMHFMNNNNIEYDSGAPDFNRDIEKLQYPIMTSESISKFNYISELQGKQVAPKIGIADSSTASFPSISSRDIDFASNRGLVQKAQNMTEQQKAAQAAPQEIIHTFGNFENETDQNYESAYTFVENKNKLKQDQQVLLQLSNDQIGEENVPKESILAMPEAEIYATPNRKERIPEAAKAMTQTPSFKKHAPISVRTKEISQSTDKALSRNIKNYLTSSSQSGLKTSKQPGGAGAKHYINYATIPKKQIYLNKDLVTMPSTPKPKVQQSCKLRSSSNSSIQSNGSAAGPKQVMTPKTKSSIKLLGVAKSSSQQSSVMKSRALQKYIEKNSSPHLMKMMGLALTKTNEISVVGSKKQMMTIPETRKVKPSVMLNSWSN